MRPSWGENLEVDVGVILDLGENFTVIPDKFVGKHKVPMVPRERAEIVASYDGAEGRGAGSACTFACTLRIGDHYTNETFEVSPLQGDHDIILPLWWTLKHPTPYLTTRVRPDIKFDSPKCVNCTMSRPHELAMDRSG